MPHALRCTSSRTLRLMIALCAAMLLIAVVDGKDLNDISITAYRGELTRINFKKLLGRNAPPGMLITITDLPVNGSLFGSSKTKQVSVGGNTAGNVFYYQSKSDYPADGTRGSDVVGFKVEIEGSFTPAKVLITVALRGLSIKNYTVDSVNPSRPRNLQLRVRDGSGAMLTLANGLLGSVQLESLPTNGCVVKQFTGEEFTASSLKVTDVNLRVVIQPRADMQEGESCTFAYTATRRNGVKTAPAYVTLKQFGTAGFIPRAYATTTIYNVESDTARMIELVGSTRNRKSNLTFVITKMPSIGQVFDIAETTLEQLPLYGMNASTPLPITIYQGSKTRIVLFYQVSPKAVKKVPRTVTLEYFVKDALKSSLPQTVTIQIVKKESPVCGQVVVSPVFWDKPVKDIVLNFTNPNGRQIQKLILLSGPKKPIGDLLYERTTARGSKRIPLTVGSYFTDKQNRLTYLVRRNRMRMSENETYKFRAQSMDGMSCVGTISFIVMQHDVQIVPKGENVRRELVRLDTLTLLPLWGTANKTITKPSSVVISGSPNFGTIYQLLDNAPYEPGMMYRVNRRGQARSYCVRHNCDEYRGDRIDAGDSVVRQRLWKEETLESSTRFWILYRSPSNLANFANVTDTFEYHFFNDAGEKSEVQRVVVSFRKRLKRVITCNYKAIDRNYNFDRQQETLIKCVLSNATNQAVMIPEFDKYRRHGAEVNFRIFQFRQDANRVFKGARLENKTRDNIKGMWVDNENTVLVVPSGRARSQVFQFRAIVYNITGSSSALMPSTKEEVRVIVRRENSVPFWNYEYTTGRGSIETTTGAMADMEIVAEDLDDDLLQFRLAKGVTKGTLYFEEMRFGLVTLQIVKTGAVMRIPKGAFARQSARLHYKADGQPGWTYPQTDSFTVYADDGGGVLSSALVFNITLTGDAVLRKSQGRELTVSYGTIAVVLISVLSIFFLVLAAVLRRRSRQKYMAVPTDTEMR